MVCCFKKAEVEVDIGALDIDIEDLQSSVALNIDIVDLESGVAHDEPLSARSNVQRHSGIGEGEGVGLEGSKQLGQIQTFKQHKKMQKASKKAETVFLENSKNLKKCKNYNTFRGVVKQLYVLVGPFSGFFVG